MEQIRKIIFKLGQTELTKALKKKKDNNFDYKKYIISNNLKLSDEYIYLSKEYGYNQFNEDIVFKSLDKLPITGDDNLCPIGIIYGWGKGENSLQKNRKIFLDQIPENYFVFAEGLPGDQLCINQIDQKIYYWYHESLENEGLYLVANSLLDFFKSLHLNPNSEIEDDLEEEWFSDDF